MTYPDSEIRLTRSQCTKKLETIIQRLTEKNFAEADFGLNYGRPRAGLVEIARVWVCGSYARGAKTCGDLDLCIEFSRGERLAYPNRLARAVFGSFTRVSVFSGTPLENSSGVEFADAVLLWAVGREIQNALVNIKTQTSSEHFVRKSDDLPFSPVRLGCFEDEIEKLLVSVDAGLVKWTHITLSSLPAQEPFDGTTRNVLTNSCFYPKYFVALLPYLFSYLQQHERNFTNPTIRYSSGLYIGHLLITTSRPPLTDNTFDALGVSKIIVFPKLSGKGPNGVIVFERGDKHPEVLLQQLANIRPSA